MARVTVEDCVEVIPNRFELILCASQRAREIDLGDPIHVMRENDKNTVVALREIAENKVIQSDLEESIIRRFQKGSQGDDEDGKLASDDSDQIESQDEAELLARLRQEMGDSMFSGNLNDSIDMSADDEDEEDEEE